MNRTLSILAIFLILTGALTGCSGGGGGARILYAKAFVDWVE